MAWSFGWVFTWLSLGLRLRRSDRGHRHGVTVKCALYGHVLSGVFIEVFIVPLQLINLVSDDEGVASFLRAGTSAIRRAHVLHLVLGAAHNVAHLAGQSCLLALRNCSGERNQSESSGYHRGPEDFIEVHFASPLRLGKSLSAYTRFGYTVTAKSQKTRAESGFVSAAIFPAPASRPPAP